jgi:citrate lyase subunit beta/citryl-CoA lyase
MASTPRSYLFVPGDRPERFSKACTSGADAVIVDLEDAVAPEKKNAARAALAAWLHPDHPVIVRINAADTAWFSEDCALAGRPGVAAIMLPKAERPDTLEALRAAGARAVLPLIETAVGYDEARALAGAAGVERLAFGSIDFQLDLGVTGEDEELRAFRSGLVLASRLAGIAAPVDGVSTAIDDPAQLAADAARARRLGFGGKLCIHPKQVQVVNAAFSPTEADVQWATRVLAAAASANGAAVAVDGKMVDRPVLLRARMVLDNARQ